MKTVEVAKDVTFLGWITNGTLPVFQDPNGDLYTAYNPEIRELEVGAKGKIVYKSDSSGGRHYFESNQ